MSPMATAFLICFPITNQFSFLQVYTNRIMCVCVCVVFFCVWFLSLIIMLIRSILVYVWSLSYILRGLPTLLLNSWAVFSLGRPWIKLPLKKKKKLLNKFICRYTSSYLFSKLLQSELSGQRTEIQIQDLLYRDIAIFLLRSHYFALQTIFLSCTIFLKPLQ